MTDSVHALIEAVLVAGRSVFDLVLQQEIVALILDATVQFALVRCRDWKGRGVLIKNTKETESIILPPYLGTHLTSLSKPLILKLLLSYSWHCFARTSDMNAGQPCVLHDLYLTRFPIQYFPWLAGAGELQWRCDDCTPPPHGRLQSLNADQTPQPPSMDLSAFRSRSTHFAFWHQRLLPGPPQLVPSAQGMACERQPSESVSPGVTHHRALHSGCAWKDGKH